MVLLQPGKMRLIAAGSVLTLALVLGACTPADSGSGTTLGTTSAPALTDATTTMSDGGTTSDTESSSETGELELTLEELAQYNGKDGQPAYVAVDGIIYDVSALDGWAGGDHNGFEAGNDLTREIDEESPHGRSTLERAVIVGKLVEP